MQRVMLYDQILLKMAGIRLIVIVCVLLMYSDSITEFCCSFHYASRLPSFKGSCNIKQCASKPKFNLSFFLIVKWYLLLKSGDIDINPGPILPYALMMKESELFESK